MEFRTLAVIPARGGSRRLPRKNVRPFLGRPLIQWSVAFARSVPEFTEIFVSTDSDEIAQACEAIGHRVSYRRPAQLATDTATSVDVAIDALDVAERTSGRFDLVALLQPTSPLRERERWEAAFAAIADGGCDAVIGVSPVQTHPDHAFRHLPDLSLVPWSGGERPGRRSQELPPAVSVCGGLYLIGAATLRSQRTFFPDRTKGILCSEPYESIDIDTEADWVMAEALASHYGKTA